MKRIPINTTDFQHSLLKDITAVPSTNRKQLETAQKALTDVIRHDLTERQRQLIYLYYYQQMENYQIASYLHLDASTVSRTLSRARKKIYHHLHVYFDYLYPRPEDEAET